MVLQSSQGLPELLFYTKKSYKILQAPTPAPIPAPMLHVHITLQSREFSIQNPILHTEDKELFEYYYYTPVTPVAPETFQTFQSFMTFQPLRAILQCSSISRESTPFQHSPIRMHILHILQFLQFDWFPQKTPPSTSWAITDITNIHSKKGRCCDIG